MAIISEKDIRFYGHTISARDTLPELLNSLIVNSKTKYDDIQFPKATGVGTSGPDGIVKGADKYLGFIPEGDSLWELGTNEIWYNKAEKDYLKTKEQIDIQEAKNQVFVFVTTQRPDTKKRDNWIKDKKAETYFKDILVLGSNEIAQWVEHHPDFINSYYKIIRDRDFESLGFYPFQKYFERFFLGKIPPAYLLDLRSEESSKFIDKYNSNSLIRVSSRSKQESISFALASLDSHQKRSKRLFLFIEDENALHYILEHCENLDMVVDKEYGPNVHSKAKQYGNRLIECIGNQYSSSSIELIQQSKENIASKLRGHLEFDIEQSYRVADQSKGSFTQLLRLLRILETTPSWLNSDISGKTLFIINLMGGINLKNSEDLNFMEVISDGQITVELLLKLSKGDDPLLTELPNRILVVNNPLESWRFLIKKNVVDLEIVADAISLLIDRERPELHESFRDKFNKSINGESKTIYPSIALTEGLLNSLCGLSFVCEEDDNKEIRNTLDNSIFNLLSNSSSLGLKSLSNQFSKLAEIAPQSFIHYFLEEAKVDDSKVIELFDETEGITFPMAYYTDLVRALEGLILIDNVRVTCIKLTCKLIEIDPGGTYANRPKAVLEDAIYQAYNFFTVHERIEIIEIINSGFPDIHKKLLMTKFTESTSSMRSSYPFLFNGRIRHENFRPKLIDRITFDRYRFTSLLNCQLSGKEKRIIFKRILYLTGDLRLELLKDINSNIDSNIYEDTNFYSEIEQVVFFLDNDADFDLKLKKEESEIIKNIMILAEPKNMYEEWKWIFGQHKHGLIKRHFGNDFHEQLLKLKDKKIEVLKYVYNKSGIAGLVKKIARHKYANAVDLVPFVIPAEEYKGFVSTYLKSETIDPNFLRIFVHGLRTILDENEISKFIIEFRDIDSNLIVPLLHGMPNNYKTFKFVDSFGEEIESTYWELQKDLIGFETVEDLEIGFEKLKKFKHYSAFFDSFSQARYLNLSPQKIANLLLKIEFEDDPYSPFNLLSLEQIFRFILQLDSIDEQTKVSLEFKYFPFLVGSSKIKLPRFEKELLKSPQEFVSFCKSASENDSFNMWSFLRRLSFVPKTEDDQIDFAKIESWIQEVLELLKDSDLDEQVHNIIGQYLSSVSEKDRVIPIEIAKLLEEFPFKQIKIGYIQPQGGYSFGSSWGEAPKGYYAKEKDRLQSEINELEKLNLIIAKDIVAHRLKEVEADELQESKFKDNEISRGYFQ